MTREMYTHTRNYGCRLRCYLFNGVEMLSLENRRLKVAVALGKGADIVEWAYKPMDVDFMWHSFNPLGPTNDVSSVASPDGSFLDTYSGGWQDLFPTYGGRALYRGAPLGVHGEACLYPWDCEIVRDEPDCVEALLTLRTRRSPFRLTKTLRLAGEEAALSIREAVVNEGSTEQAFMWGQHPAFGVPFLDESVRIRLSGEPDLFVPAEAIAHRCPFDRPTRGKWPILPDRDGAPVDMSRACAPEARRYMEYCVAGLAKGQYTIVNENLDLGFRLSWDIAVFPYLWVWALYCGIDDYPWYGRSYVLAVEPWSTVPADYEGALKNGGRLLRLGAGERMETELVAEVILERKAEAEA